MLTPQEKDTCVQALLLLSREGMIAIDGANTVKTVAMAALVGGCVIKWSAQAALKVAEKVL